MKVTKALIAATAQARVKDFCSLKAVPSDYECIRGHAGMWECSRECPFGAGKRRMDCECSQLHGCQWNAFEGWCIKDETTMTETTPTTTSTTTTSTTTTSTTTSTTTTSTTTSTTTTTTTLDEIEAEEETEKTVTEVLQTTTMNDKPVEFTFQIDDLNAACPTDLAPDGNTWTCYSEFQATGDTTTCNRQCQDGSGQAEINVCTCTGFVCSWEIEAECMYAEEKMEAKLTATQTLKPETIEPQTTIMLESTTTTALHTPSESTTMRPRSMMMDAVENEVEEEAEEVEEQEVPETAETEEAENAPLQMFHETPVSVKFTFEELQQQLNQEAEDASAQESAETEPHPLDRGAQNEDSEEINQEEPVEESQPEVNQETETDQESDQEKPSTDQSVVKLELEDATQDDLDEQTSGNPFSGFLQSLQQFAKLTLVSIDEGFVQPVRYSLGVEENPK